MPAAHRPALPARFARVVASLALVATAVASVAQTIPQPKLPTVRLSAGMHNIVAEVAREPQQQQIGMMMRTEMAQHEGMLFVNEEVAPRCFWMRNTLLPLSIAFIANDGTIVNIDEMQPKTDASHCSKEPVRFVLEMNAGWFSKRGIKAGFKLRGDLDTHALEFRGRGRFHGFDAEDPPDGAQADPLALAPPQALDQGHRVGAEAVPGIVPGVVSRTRARHPAGAGAVRAAAQAIAHRAAQPLRPAFRRDRFRRQVKEHHQCAERTAG